MVDIPRAKGGRKRRLRYMFFLVLGVCALAAVTIALSRLKAAPPTVERTTVNVDTVRRGAITREVRGVGTLVPEETRWIPAPVAGRVERVFVQPGTAVGVDTVLVELTTPELQQSAQDAQFQLQAAEADLKDLRVKLESDRMAQQAVVAAAQSEYTRAKLRLDTDETLARDGLVPELTLKLSRVTVSELANRQRIEHERLEVSARSATAQLAAQDARIAQYNALARLRRQQIESLRVRAGVAGVLQQVSVEVGQQVTPGMNLARVADPRSLKAELKIPETQAKDIQLGQPASVDTRNGVIAGTVRRIDPAVQQGTVTVDVALEGPLPQGVRPDLSVDGTVRLEQLADVLYIGRPAFGQEKSTVAMFRLEEGGQSASRVQVTLGRSSVGSVEVVAGLREGDQVVLSDMSAWDGINHVRFKD